MSKLLEPLRVCRSCGLKAYDDKTLELFKPHKKRPHGRATLCKKCFNKYQLNRKRTNDRFYLKFTYKDMIGRCYLPTNIRYPYYGEREITVCDEWVTNPESFVDWALNNGWERGLTIERVNNEGPYGPGNCRWATMKEQGANKRNTVTFAEKGTRICCKCKVEKPFTDFHIDRRNPQGRRYDCKECLRRSRMSLSMTNPSKEDQS